MDDPMRMNETFRFDAPGSLQPPGPRGRLIRAGFGVLCLMLVWNLAASSQPSDLALIPFWFWAAFGLVLAPYVVNIGWGVRWGAWPRVVGLAAVIVTGGVGYLLSGQLVNPAVWWVVVAIMVYVYGHLGLSFALSAILATPGCEMRAIPHLAGKIAGQPAREHYCPGFIDTVDRWERNLGVETGTVTRRDLLDTPGRLMAFYGIPFIALQLAGNLGGPLVGNGVPALAFLFVAAVCGINALRCRRVHCLVLAPWFLAAGIATALLTTGDLDLGPGSWSLIVNTGLAGGFCLGLLSEQVFGRYPGRETRPDGRT